MAHRYRITQSSEVSVEDGPAFVGWAEQIVERAESDQARVISGLMRVAARVLTDVPGVRLHDSRTKVHRFDPSDEAEPPDLRGLLAGPPHPALSDGASASGGAPSETAAEPRPPEVGATLDFGYPGDGGLGDRLLAAVLDGTKTATSSLAVEYLSGEPLPRPGERLTLVDHSGTANGTVETTKVRIIPLRDVGDDVARDEGEGFSGAAEWRREHEAFWQPLRDLIRQESGDPDWVLRDAEPVVVQWFRLIDPPIR